MLPKQQRLTNSNVDMLCNAGQSIVAKSLSLCVKQPVFSSWWVRDVFSVGVTV